MTLPSTMAPPPPVRACLFDMDGLLIDTEDLYTAAVNTVLRAHSRPDLPWSIKAQLQGRPGPASGRIFAQWAQLPIPYEAYLAQQAAAQKSLFPTCAPLPGAEALLRRLAASSSSSSSSGAGQKTAGAGGVQIALATSSHAGNYALKTAHLAPLFDLFPADHVIKGDDPRIPKDRGKPAPDIYLLALDIINASLAARREKGEDVGPDIAPRECLVFEDSVPGVEAGRRAGMQVLWVPHLGLLGEYAGKEPEVLAGCSGMVHEHLARSRAGEDDMVMPPAGVEVGDGWGRMVMSLEGFDYASYGIEA